MAETSAGKRYASEGKAGRLKAACLAAGFVVATAGKAAHADPLLYDVTITPSTALSDVTFIFGLGPCSPLGYAVPLAATAPANSASRYQGSFEIGWTDGDPNDGNEPSGYYTVIGLYDKPAGGEGVAIMYMSAIASQLLSLTDTDTSWLDTNLPGIYQSQFSPINVNYTEAQIATALAANDTATLEDFAHWYSRAAPDAYSQVIGPACGNMEDVTLLDFSGAAAGGDGTAIAGRVVPEPASAALLSLPIIFVAARRRARRSR